MFARIISNGTNIIQDEFVHASGFGRYTVFEILFLQIKFCDIFLHS
jgi:hypothetical protein